MAVEYKNAITSVTSTGSDQAVYTCPTTTTQIQYTAIIKTCTVYNTTGGGGTLEVKVTDASASATISIMKFAASAYAAATTVDVASNGPIVLESEDILKIDTSVQPAIVYISVMEISDDLRGV